jgi:thymidylate synthase (FAD)
MAIDVVLIDHARDPLMKLYGAYRTCYTAKTPREVWDELNNQEVTGESVTNFVTERLKTGHVSPLEQVVFWFGISGVSRALSHQLVRHRIGISFEQQSQRYVKYKPGKFEFLTPPLIEKASLEVQMAYQQAMETAGKTYQLLLDNGIPAEDARFVFPNAMPTNFQIMVNYAELLHICDLRLCHRAQWEIRYMVGLMRAAVRKAVPELAANMQPKCGEHRLGYCDEDKKAYMACPLSKARPHKEDLFAVYKEALKNTANLRVLTDEDIQPESPK